MVASTKAAAAASTAPVEVRERSRVRMAAFGVTRVMHVALRPASGPAIARLSAPPETPGGTPGHGAPGATDQPRLLPSASWAARRDTRLPAPDPASPRAQASRSYFAWGCFRHFWLGRTPSPRAPVRRSPSVGAPQAAVEARARGRIFTDGELVWLGTIFASQCSHILSNIRSLRWAKSYDLFLKQSWNGPASFARPASSMSISSRRPIKPASVRTRTSEQVVSP